MKITIKVDEEIGTVTTEQIQKDIDRAVRTNGYFPPETVQALLNKLTELEEALKAAHIHLEYCNYGDSWERECAEGLDEQITKALR